MTTNTTYTHTTDNSINQLSLSVIIPIYNCERYVAIAIESALAQPEVTEVVVVDDGSQDASLAICKELQLKDNRVKIFQHLKEVNKGRSASRNLGIENATGNYIAFLDADDYYLDNRFTNDFKMFLSNKNCDGVYNAVGFHFYRTATEQELATHQLYTVIRTVAFENLFVSLLYGKVGHFHINGLTVKREVVAAIRFNEKLVVAEDTEVFWKMAIKHRLYTGIITHALAIRGVHDTNVFDNAALYREYTMKMFETLLIWCSHNQVKHAIKDDLLKWIWILKHKQANPILKDMRYWGGFFFGNPRLLFSVFSIKYFPIIRFRQMLFPFLYKKWPLKQYNEK